MLTSDLHLSASFRLENLLTYIYVDLYPYKAYFLWGILADPPFNPRQYLLWMRYCLELHIALSGALVGYDLYLLLPTSPGPN